MCEESAQVTAFDALTAALLLDAPDEAKEWYFTRKDADLINKYPHIYWQVIFSYYRAQFEGAFSSSRSSSSCPTPSVIGLFNDYGFLPEEDHRRDALADRPPVRQLWANFVSNPFYKQFLPDHEDRSSLAIKVPAYFGEILKDGGLYFLPTSMGSDWLDVRFASLFNFLYEQIWLYSQKQPLISFPQVFTTKLALALVVFAEFYNAVNIVTDQAEQLQKDVIEALKVNSDNLAELQVEAREAFLCETIQLFCESDRFVAANGSKTEFQGRYCAYLASLGAIKTDWVWPKMTDGPNPKRVLSSLPILDPENVSQHWKEFLYRICILPALESVTQGMLLECLIESLIDLDREEPKQLPELEDNDDNEEPEVNAFEVRDQIVWILVALASVFRNVDTKSISSADGALKPDSTGPSSGTGGSSGGGGSSSKPSGQTKPGSGSSGSNDHSSGCHSSAIPQQVHTRCVCAFTDDSDADALNDFQDQGAFFEDSNGSEQNRDQEDYIPTYSPPDLNYYYYDAADYVEQF